MGVIFGFELKKEQKKGVHQSMNTNIFISKIF